MSELDRFDRMLLAAPIAPGSAKSLPAMRHGAQGDPATQVLSGMKQRPAGALEREPVITSERGPRFVDHTTCPMCGTDGEGVEYHGTLMTGAKVHTIAAHTEGRRMVERGRPRCLGSGMRIVFAGGTWRGAP